jgi:methylated-DNA-[protein]-cysteine S-methyltransferase
MTKVVSTTMTTPLGPFTMIGGDDGMIGAGFTATAEALHAALRLPLNGDPIVSMHDLGEMSAAADRYFAGDVHAIDEIPVTQVGSRFQLSAWSELRKIPVGETISYRELATRTRSGARAAGSACGRNTVTLFVPCHRVVRTGGDLGGYAWGLDKKRWLLAHERSTATGLRRA